MSVSKVKDQEQVLADYLFALVKRADRARAYEEWGKKDEQEGKRFTWEGWGEDFEALSIHRNKSFVELTYRDSGVGEDYVAQAFKYAFPRLAVDVDVEGGCDSCGYGRRVSLALSGSDLPWELAPWYLRPTEVEKLTGSEFHVELEVLFACVGRLLQLGLEAA